MIDRLPSSLVELGSLVATIVLATVLTVVGLVVEAIGVLTVLTGEAALGAWELALGLLLCYAGMYLLGYRRVLPQLRTLLGSEH